MRCRLGFAVAAAAVLVFAPARGEDAAPPAQEVAAPAQEVAAPAHETAAPAHEAAAPAHACLDQKERRAEYDSGKVVRLGVAMRAARGRMAGTVVGARLCRGKDGLVYVLTVLAHDGKVARITVDAAKGTLVGGR